MKLKIGIIGCGMVTKVRHAPEYHANPNCELAAFYDTDPERAKAMQEKYGGVVCSSVDELLALDLDAVSVCVANAAHAEVTVKALNAGRHVLCEKPMAVTIGQCEAMVEAAERNHKNLMIGHNQRFAAAHKKAHDMVADGTIGKVLSFETKFGHGGPELWTGTKNTWFFDKKQAAFGAMADLGIHKTDLIHYLIGEPITEVYAVTATMDKKTSEGKLIDVDDNAFCIYRMDSGITGFMQASWTFYGNEKNSFVVYGTKGVIRCYDDREYSLILETKDGKTNYLSTEGMNTNSDQTLGKRNNTGVIDEFIESICEEREPSVSGKDEIQAMRVVFAALESGKTGQTVKVIYP